MEELDVTKMVFCPDQQMVVDCNDCCGCEYYHGMGDLDFTFYNPNTTDTKVHVTVIESYEEKILSNWDTTKTYEETFVVSTGTSFNSMNIGYHTWKHNGWHESSYTVDYETVCE